MKYEITYSCGHKGTVELFGPGKERERKIWWYENRCDCPACAEANRRAKLEQQMEKDAEAGLAPITIGSEKQIAWATSIRDQLIRRMMTKVQPEYAERVNKIIAKIAVEKNDARWWIDNRNSDRVLIDEVGKRFNA